MQWKMDENTLFKNTLIFLAREKRETNTYFYSNQKDK